jgi:hypothetical protein
MVSSDWIDIAIGVVVVWFLLALVVSAVNEGINRVFAFRAKNLWRTLEQMLDHNVPKSGTWGGLLGGLHEFFHWWGRPFDPDEPPLGKPEEEPVLPMLVAPGPTADAGAADGTASPAMSKEDAKRAAKALKHAQKEAERAARSEASEGRKLRGLCEATCTPFDRTVTADTPQPAGRTTARIYGTGAVQALETRASAGQKTRISNIPTPVFAQALIEVLMHTPEAPGEEPTIAGTVAEASAAVDLYISRLHDSNPFKKDLDALWTTANKDLDRFRQNVESWFDGQMARASRLYKKRIRVLLFVVGLVVAFATFAIGIRSDSLALVSDLQHDKNLTSGLVGLADTATSEDLAKLGCPDQSTTTDTTPADLEECKVKGASKAKNFDLIFSDPVHDQPIATASVRDRLRFLVDGSHWYLIDASHWRTWVGLILTAIALSFGATFWFDLLRRLVGIRATVTNQA